MSLGEPEYSLKFVTIPEISEFHMVRVSFHTALAKGFLLVPHEETPDLNHFQGGNGKGKSQCFEILIKYREIYFKEEVPATKPVTDLFNLRKLNSTCILYSTRRDNEQRCSCGNAYKCQSTARAYYGSSPDLGEHHDLSNSSSTNELLCFLALTHIGNIS